MIKVLRKIKGVICKGILFLLVLILLIIKLLFFDEFFLYLEYRKLIKVFLIGKRNNI